MKKILNIKKPMTFLAATSVFVGCATSPTAQVVKSSDPQKTEDGYVIYKSGSVSMPPMRKEVLSNGLKIHLIKDNKLPRVSINLLLAVGSASEPEGYDGLNAFTASLLDQGTKKWKALEIADKLGALGTEIEIKPGSDFITIAADALVSDADELLDIVAEVVMAPKFDQAEIERARSQVIALIKKKEDNPGQFASQKFEEWIFKGHPYAKDELGTIESIQKIQRKDVLAHYKKWFRPQVASMAITGQFDEAFAAKAKKVFASWAAGPSPEVISQQIVQAKTIEVKVDGKPGLKQAEIRMGQKGLPRGSADFMLVRMANEALGGSFGSRLNQVIRDDQGLTYSIYSFMDGRGQTGSFQISTFTKNETVGKTVSETIRVFQEFVKNGITQRELDAAKNQLAGQFPRSIETSDRLAFNILALDYYGVPFSYLTDFNRNVRAVTLADVNNAIKKYFDKDSLKVLVYADPVVAGQLKSYQK